MPDADRFERLLRGKGWRRAYRLASGNAPMSIVVDALTRASAHGLRDKSNAHLFQEYWQSFVRH